MEKAKVKTKEEKMHTFYTVVGILMLVGTALTILYFGVLPALARRALIKYFNGLGISDSLKKSSIEGIQKMTPEEVLIYWEYTNKYVIKDKTPKGLLKKKIDAISYKYNKYFTEPDIS
jgi:hypothetical protein